jgi:hypothetical protein
MGTVSVGRFCECLLDSRASVAWLNLSEGSKLYVSSWQQTGFIPIRGFTPPQWDTGVLIVGQAENNQFNNVMRRLFN